MPITYISSREQNSIEKAKCFVNSINYSYPYTCSIRTSIQSIVIGCNMLGFLNNKWGCMATKTGCHCSTLTIWLNIKYPHLDNCIA